MSDDDDLRFGDVDGSTNSGGGGRDIPNAEDIMDLLIQGIVIVVILYVFFNVIQVLFNIPIPFV